MIRVFRREVGSAALVVGLLVLALWVFAVVRLLRPREPFRIHTGGRKRAGRE